MTQPDLFKHPQAYGLQEFDIERYFAVRLKQHGSKIDIFAGSTTFEIRRERIRTAIIEGHFDVTVIGRNPSGAAETYEKLFARYYGEPLEPRSRKTRTE